MCMRALVSLRTKTSGAELARQASTSDGFIIGGAHHATIPQHMTARTTDVLYQRAGPDDEKIVCPRLCPQHRRSAPRAEQPAVLPDAEGRERGARPLAHTRQRGERRRLEGQHTGHKPHQHRDERRARGPHSSSQDVSSVFVGRIGTVVRAGLTGSWR